MLRWFVAESEYQRERTAVDNLKLKNFEAYCPTWLRKRAGHRRGPITIEEALFPNYLFVAFDLAIDGWKAINSTIGIRHILAMDVERPQPLPEGYVEDLRIDQGNFVKMADTTIRYAEGQLLRIKNGPLQNRTGRFLSAAGARLRLQMLALGASRVVWVEANDVEVMTELVA